MLSLHGRIESVMRDANLLTEDRSQERFGSKVALHLADVLLAEELEVFQSRVFLIIYGDRPHLI